MLPAFVPYGRFVLPNPPGTTARLPSEAEIAANLAAGLNSLSGAIADLSSGTVSGTVGDGTTDNSAVIQSAINSLAAAGGGTLALGTGVFACKSPLTLPAVPIRIVGQGRAATVLLYTGAAQAAFITVPAGYGSAFSSLTIGGTNAAPAVLNGANSLQTTFYDCAIGGFGNTPIATAVNPVMPQYLSLQGLLNQGDDCKLVSSWFYGKQYGCRLETGPTVAVVNCRFYGLPATLGGVSPGYALWCATDTNVFNGQLFLSNCWATEGAIAAVMLRGACTVIGLYVDNSLLPVSCTTATVFFVGGRLRTTNPSATMVFVASNSTGWLRDLNFVVAGGAALTSVINISASPNVGTGRVWDIASSTPNNFSGANIGTNWIVCDRPHKVLVAGWREGFLAANPVPATGTVVTNPYGVSCMVYLDTVTNGSGITVTGAKINGQQVGPTGPWYVSPLDTLEIDYTGTTPLPNLVYFGVK